MNASSTTLRRNAVVYACSEESCGLPAAERELLHETGRVLLAIGHLVANVSPLEQYTKHSTANLLISLGHKLAAQ